MSRVTNSHEGKRSLRYDGHNRRAGVDKARRVATARRRRRDYRRIMRDWASERAEQVAQA